MATAIGEAFVSIRPDLSGFTREVDAEVRRSLTGISRSASDASGAQGALAAASNEADASLGRLRNTVGGLRTNYLLAAGAVGAATAALGGAALTANKWIQQASGLAEAQSAVNALFGDFAGIVSEAAEDAAGSIGQTEAAFLAGSQAVGNMLLTSGLMRDEAAKMSVDLVRLASDMASFNDQDPTEMLDRLRSGLSGEAEPLRRFGVLLSAARVEQKALELGIADGSRELTEQEKVLARYAVIMEDTAAQQGDFARTSDSLANQQRILSARWEEMTTNIGTALLPVMTRLVTFINEQGLPAIEGLAGAIASLPAVKVIQLVVEIDDRSGGLLGRVLGESAAILSGANIQRALGDIQAAGRAGEGRIDPFTGLPDDRAAGFRGPGRAAPFGADFNFGFDELIDQALQEAQVSAADPNFKTIDEIMGAMLDDSILRDNRRAVRELARAAEEGAEDASRALGSLAGSVGRVSDAFRDLTAHGLAMEAAEELVAAGARSVAEALDDAHPAARRLIRDLAEQETLTRDIADALLGITEAQDTASGFGSGSFLGLLSARRLAAGLDAGGGLFETPDRAGGVHIENLIVTPQTPGAAAAAADVPLLTVALRQSFEEAT